MNHMQTRDNHLSGSVDYSGYINWDDRKWITIVIFTLWHNLHLKHCHPSFLRIVFRHIFWQFWVNLLSFTSIIVRTPIQIISQITRVFYGFYVCMCKLHAECQILADIRDRCQLVFWYNIQKVIRQKMSLFLGWSVGTLAQYIWYKLDLPDVTHRLSLMMCYILFSIVASHRPSFDILHQ